MDNEITQQWEEEGEVTGHQREGEREPTVPWPAGGNSENATHDNIPALLLVLVRREMARRTKQAGRQVGR